MSSISTTLEDLEKRQVLLGTNITDLRAKNIEYEDRFNTIGPIIKRMMSAPGSIPLSTAMPAGDLERRILKLESTGANKIVQQLCERVSSLELNGPQRGTPVSWLHDSGTDTTPDLGFFRDAIGKLNAKVDSLERRVVGDGLSIGLYVFQSFEDLRVWMKTHVPNNRYGLFVDVIGLFELFCTEHVDVSTTIGTFHSSQRTGFATMYESSLAASMQNVLPSLLGKGNTDGMDTSRFLPPCLLLSLDIWRLIT